MRALLQNANRDQLYVLCQSWCDAHETILICVISLTETGADPFSRTVNSLFHFNKTNILRKCRPERQTGSEPILCSSFFVINSEASLRCHAFYIDPSVSHVTRWKSCSTKVDRKVLMIFVLSLFSTCLLILCTSSVISWRRHYKSST